MLREACNLFIFLTEETIVQLSKPRISQFCDIATPTLTQPSNHKTVLQKYPQLSKTKKKKTQHNKHYTRGAMCFRDVLK